MATQQALVRLWPLAEFGSASESLESCRNTTFLMARPFRWVRKTSSSLHAMPRDVPVTDIWIGI